ncbi:MAG: hypothetical protein HY790_08825 [Deltaproteobacteria bacterium]|jgi:hypothetical protein|nr:hypothetical protein [Deltaproteobacteria bacterium]MBI4795922.1 hypothetical protein [Deltaproteobacteria bacterium]
MAMKKEEMIEAKKLNPVDFLAKVLEAEKHTDHICWKCKYLKWVLKGSGFPPADIIGWCKKIHWPHYWSISEMDVIKKCYAFEAKS